MSGNTEYRILVVDDEILNINVLYQILSPLYDVVVAKNGQTAIRVARKHAPDLILLDIVMPDMTGFEVITELKNSDLTRRIPVIFITGLDNNKDEEKGLLLGAVDYIAKPFHNSIVKARVATQLQIVEYIRTIERLGMIDALTEIPNRRGFNHQLNVEWNRSMREKNPVGLLMLDIDNFKQINDHYGHSHGDAVLKTVAKIISKSLKRPADFAARWGGEEFAVLLPCTDLDGAKEVAESIRVNVEKAATPREDGSQTCVTISIGANAEIPALASSCEILESGADKALYTAKRSGKNRVCAYSQT